jgi:hypothetical protein
VNLADAHGLASDANRETLKAFAADRGIKARTTVLAEVLRRRKAVPTLGNSSTREAAFPCSGTAGTADSDNGDSEHENG